MTPSARHAAIALILALAAAAAIVAAVGLLGPALAGPLSGTIGGEALFTVLLFGLLIAVACIALRIEGRRLALGDRPAHALALGALIGIGGLMLALGDAGIAGTVRPGAGASGGVMLFLLGTLLMLFQSAAEEVYFRGWLQPALVRGWGPVAGVGATALAFAALHVAGGARSPVTLLNLFLGGLLFGLLALRSNGVVAPVAAHAGWNWAEGLLFGLDPNPGAGRYGALFDRDLTGPALWGGSDEGLNASIAMTVALLAILPPLIAQGWRPAARRISASGSPG